ncbi:P-loop NTPase family protein [Microbacterium pygmaeum]|uniref:ABC transporter n=1 Tax=Microbacterium pygmaeum TaxID=370764 RepID=A0A1G7UMD3_9MICO|nr:hypothetical protein [Microbacterium pygmaeum]SDG48722.1 hypothetical protein SAMN04489810_0430 [Microbacterium pygmaeum]
MKVELREVAKGRRMHALPETSLTFESGRVVLVAAETEQRPTVLGLIASGRLRPDAGSVTIDGRTDASALRLATALVDAPDVSEPEPNVSVAGVVAEELMFAGLASHPIAARRWLEDLGIAEIAGTPIGNVEPEERIRILCELAALRAGVAGLVLTSPDRHGGEPAAWWSIAEDFAGRGLAVLVIAGRASAALLAHAESPAAGEEQVLAAEAERPVPADEAPAADADPAPEASERRTIPLSSEDSGEIVRHSDNSPTLGSEDGRETDAGEADAGTPPTDEDEATRA